MLVIFNTGIQFHFEEVILNVSLSVFVAFFFFKLFGVDQYCFRKSAIYSPYR